MRTPPDSLEARNATAIRRFLGGAAGGRLRTVAPIPGQPPAPKRKDLGPGARFATLSVAASDSTVKGRRGADFVCDPSAADVSLQLAIDAIGNGRGFIKLLEGSYFLAAPFAPTVTARIAIEGCGGDVTVITGDASFPSIDLTASYPASTPSFRLANVGFSDGLVALQWKNADGSIEVENCLFSGCTQAIKSLWDSTGTNLDYGVLIARNLFDSCGDSSVDVIELGQRTYELRIIDNNFVATASGARSEIHVTSGDTGQHGVHPRIHGNGADRKGIFVAYHNALSMVGNSVNGDVTLDHITDAAIAGNVCWGTYGATNMSGTIAKAGNVGIV